MTDAESLFRHSGWLDRRRATHLALMEAGAKPPTVERFNNCGAAAWVMVDKADPTRARVQCERCRNRWCEACARERRLLVQQNLAKNLPKVRLRFLTLTLKSTDAGPGDEVRRLYAGFKKLRQRAKIKTLLHGGIAFLELTYTPERRQFHPHLHIVFQGRFIPHKMLRNEWLSVTGDSFIVDVREIPQPQYAIGYVTKYASKAVGASIWRDPQVFPVVIRELHGLRTLFTFGSWRGFKLLEAPTLDGEWHCIGRLHDLVTAAAGGDSESKRLLSSLQRYIPASEHAADSLFNDDG